MSGLLTDAQQRFESDLSEVLAEPIRSDQTVAEAVYAALCNVEWHHDDGAVYASSWRLASELVATIRNVGEHDLDLYLSGREGSVDPIVEAALATRGWAPRTV